MIKEITSVPLISIITIAYNAVEVIENTILSVIKQTYSNIEYIIIDGGSTDGTIDIIKKYESYITYWISEPDNGIYDAMNKGIKKATGDWINFINSGDCLLDNNVISKFIQLHDPSADIIYGDTKISISNIKTSYIHKPEPIELMEKKMVFGHPSSFVKANILKTMLFDTSFKSSGDYNFFIQCYRNHKSFQYIPIVISVFDYGTGMSNNFKINRYEDARIHGIENKISWKISFITSYITWKIRVFLKNILPKGIVQKYYTRRNG
ncbi:glycosyltransferase family 2 protein [Dysgonomonas sp. Marseille-Q5470]|uniref:glycosyltransferase family 2 protein n=1 Tax=Dysgonomonas sp. Marseille-Q5470 TaxID=3039494 RepID=UPI0024BBEC25|nr:glycosyltransferase family 2 protein [Dysgonomonas sp. Marseille-Q5470]